MCESGTKGYNKGMKMKEMIVAMMMIATTALADDIKYKDVKSVEAALLPAKDIKVGWSSVARGGEAMFWSSYKTFDANGDVVSSSWSFGSSKHGGAVLAIPVGDFDVKSQFRYRGADKNGVTKELTGLLVKVKVQVSTGGGNANQMACQKAVENMVKVGVSLSKGVGCKPMRYRPLTETAKKRFGARLVRVRYCGDQSQVKLLLLDCDKDQADESFLPATPHALTRDGRLALAKKLKPNEDKGFTIMGSSETEEHPIDSPHAPDGDGWGHDGRKHTKSTFFDSRRAGK